MAKNNKKLIKHPKKAKKPAGKDRVKKNAIAFEITATHVSATAAIIGSFAAAGTLVWTVVFCHMQ